MVTARAIRTSADDVDLETDFTKYNLGIENLWGDLKLASKGLALSPVVDVAGALRPTGTGGSVFDVLSNQGAGGGDASERGENPEGTSAPTGALGAAVGMGASFGVSTGLSSIGVPGAIAGVAGSLAGRAAQGKDVGLPDVVNASINAALNGAVPGLGIALGMLGFNPAQGLTEAFGLSDVTPGFEGGFFGKQGIGFGVDSGMAGSGTPAGFGANDLGSGLAGTNGIGPEVGISAPGTQDIGGLQAAPTGLTAQDIDISDIMDAINAISPSEEQGYDSEDDSGYDSDDDSGYGESDSDSDSDSDSGSGDSSDNAGDSDSDSGSGSDAE